MYIKTTAFSTVLLSLFSLCMSILRIILDVEAKFPIDLLVGIIYLSKTLSDGANIFSFSSTAVDNYMNKMCFGLPSCEMFIYSFRRFSALGRICSIFPWHFDSNQIQSSCFSSSLYTIHLIWSSPLDIVMRWLCC